MATDEKFLSTYLFQKRSRPAIASRQSDFLGSVFACAIPMCMFIEVKLGGRLFLAELILLCILPFLMAIRGRLLLAPLPKKLLLLGGAWLIAQIITDIIRATPFEDWSRGWAKIIFLLTNFSAIYLFVTRRENRILLFAAGIAAGQILAYFFNPNIYAEDYSWKFGYGSAVTFLGVVVLQARIFKNSAPLSNALLLALGLWNFYMGFRSLGLICLLVGLFLFAKQSTRLESIKLTGSKIAILVVLGCFGIYGITGLYAYGSTENWFGDEAHEKYLLQSSGNLGILFGGRAEILGSGQAIIDSPIIGHGSWAKDWKYVDIMRSSLIERGYTTEGEIESDLIPSHSHIMGAWVESGFVGAIFWLWALWLTVRALIKTFTLKTVLAPLIAFVAFALLWNIPFSPFGADQRLYAAYYLILMIFVMNMSRSQIVVKSRRRT